MELKAHFRRRPFMDSLSGDAKAPQKGKEKVTLHVLPAAVNDEDSEDDSTLKLVDIGPPPTSPPSLSWCDPVVAPVDPNSGIAGTGHIGRGRGRGKSSSFTRSWRAVLGARPWHA